MRLPAHFVSHGSPLHALQAGAAGQAWSAIGAALRDARAVIVVTAHWETERPMLSAHANPPMIYDFSGFPEPLYRIRYAAPGAPDVAQAARTCLAAAGIEAALDGCRGFDHGTWVPMRLVFADAKRPIVQLSVQPSRDPAHHLAVGRALAPLCADGVAVVASGHLTHNLRDWMRPTPGAVEAAAAFQEWVYARICDHDVEALTAYRQRAPGAVRAHPSEEHFLPLFVALGASGFSMGSPVERLYAGFEGGVLAMDAYRFH